jgi:hypothetical protein
LLLDVAALLCSEQIFALPTLTYSAGGWFPSSFLQLVKRRLLEHISMKIALVRSDFFLEMG